MTEARRIARRIITRYDYQRMHGNRKEDLWHSLLAKELNDNGFTHPEDVTSMKKEVMQEANKIREERSTKRCKVTKE